MKTTVSIAMHVRCDCGASKDLGAIVERFTCRRCARPTELTPLRWGELLDAAVHDLPYMRDGTELTRDVERASGWVVACKAMPSCASCSAPLPDEAVGHGCESGCSFCTGCGAKLLVRPVPRSLASAFPGITHLFGEDIGQIANADGPRFKDTEGSVATCHNCGAGVNADGSSHAVVCSHCRSMVVLPDAVWERFHPDAEPHVFYLVHDDSVPRAPFRADFRWSSLVHAVCDKDGNIYAIGADQEAHDDRMVFALDSQLRTKWARRGLKHLDSDARLAWRNDGVVLVWNKERSAGVLLRCADGSDAGSLGGKQPEGSAVHNLDLSSVEGAAVDLDGTVIFVKERRLVRCALDGSGIPIWPAHSGFLGRTIVAKPSPFTGEPEDAPDLEKIGDYPTTTRDCEIRVGWDGCLYIANRGYLARFERTGKRSYVVPLPKSTYNPLFGADASGNAYLLLGDESGGKKASIYRFAKDGSCVRIVDGSLKETPLAMSEALVVRPDGTLVALGYGHAIQTFLPK